MVRWIRIWRSLGSDLGLLWYALNHRERPMWLVPVSLALGVYALEPLNFAIPVLGVVDDFVVLPLVLHALLKLLPRGILAAYLATPAHR